MANTEFTSHLINVSKQLKPHALRLTKDMDEAKDLLQDTIVKAIKNSEKFNDGTNMKAWMYTIMKNTFITGYQKMLRRGHGAYNCDDVLALNNPRYTTVNYSLVNFALADIQKALDFLDEEFRAPFVLYYKGFKYNEIAEELCIPIGTVKNRIHIARQELKDMLAMYR